MRGTGELVLYLDFDGVLHHEDVWLHDLTGPYIRAEGDHKLFQHAPLLDELLAPYPNVKIVLSTSWVRRYGCAKTAKNLPPSLRERVVGATFHSRMREAEFLALPRGAQVWSDVVRRQPRAWLALDDTDEGWPEHCRGHYLRTHEQLGIGSLDTRRALTTKLWQIFGSKT